MSESERNSAAAETADRLPPQPPRLARGHDGKPNPRGDRGDFRIERARLIGGLARVVRNVDRAEELAQDALVVALAEWPKAGVPANPGAWLMTTARRRAIDALSR